MFTVPWLRSALAIICVVFCMALYVASIIFVPINIRFTFVSRNRRDTYGTKQYLVARLGLLGRAVTPRHFAWQVWHLLLWTFVLCGNRRHPQVAEVASESCFQKLFSKATPQSYRFSKQLFINIPTKPQSCSPQLLPKAALQSYYRKPRPKETPPKFQSCSPKLPQSWSKASFLSYTTAPQQLNACWGDFPGKSAQLNARFWIGRGKFAISEY